MPAIVLCHTVTGIATVRALAECGVEVHACLFRAGDLLRNSRYAKKIACYHLENDETGLVEFLIEYAGKLGNRPLVRVRGLGDRILARGSHGPGARALIRPRDQDLFALGTRESVLAAALGEADPFGTPAGIEEVVEVLDRLGLRWARVRSTLLVDTPDLAAATRCALVMHAYAWHADPGVPQTRIAPA